MSENNMPAVVEESMTSMATLVMNQTSMARMLEMADLMASSKVTIPQHLRNSKGDCMAVVMQAVQWRMNPFAIAQKTHLSQSGTLGYEAQLINTVIVSTGAVRGQPEFEFVGNWDKILGKVEERKSDKGGKYYVAGWSKGDEEGLGVIVSATLRGESSPRSITVTLSQCFPRFSTQWATDPQQQITYVGVRKFSRRYAPGAILGVYTPEELDNPVSEIEINPLTPREPKTDEPPPPPSPYPDEKFSKTLLAWEKLIVSGKKDAEKIIADAALKAKHVNQYLTDDQKAAIRAIQIPVSEADLMASQEQMAMVRRTAETAEIAWSEVAKFLGIGADEILTADMVPEALAFIADPAGNS